MADSQTAVLLRSRSELARVTAVPQPEFARPVRPRVQGPFLWLGDEKLIVKAVSYGSFAPNPSGDLFPPPRLVRRDFRMMRAAHVNTVRTYTSPPNWLLEEARAAGLRVLVGISWEWRNCAYDDPDTFRHAAEAVRTTVSRCKHYPDVVLVYVVANEIPPLTTRFHGRRVVECFLERLCRVAKREDPEGLVTYANFPTTEFLELDFLDLHTVNVFLLDRRAMGAYLDRMLMRAKGKPLLLGEVGDDSMRRGEVHQSGLLDWTIPLALDKGLAGVCVFGWTDDWFVGGYRVTDWRFGIVDEMRRPKPAFEVVQRRFGEAPWARRTKPWPRVSVVVCNYNGGGTLAETLGSLLALDYPDYEVVYVDDGSTDQSLTVAQRFVPRLRIIAQENLGLSAARNVGAHAADGDIVAYIDSDAYADRDWLRQLVLAMESGDFIGAGGPNLTPPSDGRTAQFIACCPGNPTVVLKDDVQADHIAGVNMAFRRGALLSIGGFDPAHRRAGDDVDVCWRLLDAGLRLAFAPAAIVWHHRRPSMLRYLRQQYGYGEAENQLERKHPERFNLGGYIRWGGRVYLAPRRVSALFRPFIYHGRFGAAAFQTLYQKDPSYFLLAPAMIHWYLAWALLLGLSVFSLWLLPVAGVMLALSMAVALTQGLTTQVAIPLSRRERARKTAVVSLLYFLHPVVRCIGRMVPRLRRIRWQAAPRLEPAPARSWFAEMVHLCRPRKELRRFWGVADRERQIRSLHGELKRRGMSALLSQEWDNHDIRLNGSFAVEGRLYAAPEWRGEALCWGFRSYVAGPARLLLVLTLAGATAAAWQSAWLAVLFAVPLLILRRALAESARVRRTAWAAVDAVMAGANLIRYGPGAEA